MGKKIYLRPPSPDYEPDKAIQLGHIWSNPRDPGSLIGPPLPLPEDVLVNFNWKNDWAATKGHESSNMVGVWTEFLQFLGIVANAGYEWGSSKDHEFSCPRMETYSMEPTPAYVKASLEASGHSSVKKGKALYMITGVKIARGGTEAIHQAARRGIDAQLGVDGTSSGIPVSVGPKFSIFRSKYASESFGDSGDFVFAYRVREIFYDKHGLGTRPYYKGAVHDGSDARIDFGVPVFNDPQIGAKSWTEEESIAAEVADDDLAIEGKDVLFFDENKDKCVFVL